MSLATTRRTRMALVVSVLTFIVASISAASLAGHVNTSHAASQSSGVNGPRLPSTKLRASAGFTGLDGMSLVTSSRAPLWGGKDISISPYASEGYGFNGSLVQGFFLSAAVRRFGTLHSKPQLPLPLPLDFAVRHPGPAEVFAVVLSFSNKWAPLRLLDDPNFADTNAPGVIALSRGAVRGGHAWKVIMRQMVV